MLWTCLATLTIPSLRGPDIKDEIEYKPPIFTKRSLKVNLSPSSTQRLLYQKAFRNVRAGEWLKQVAGSHSHKKRDLYIATKSHRRGIFCESAIDLYDHMVIQKQPQAH